MAFDSIIKGTVTGNGAEVTPANQLKVVTETNVLSNPGNVGAIRNFSENDPGNVTGTPYLLSPETSLDFRLRTGTDTLLFNDTFNGTAQNTNSWAYTFATLTAAQPGAGTVNFSAVQGTAAAQGAFMRTFQYFPVTATAPLSVDFRMGLFTSTLVTNEVWLMGVGNPVSASAPPIDGAWLQITSAGVIGVGVFNSTQVQTGVLLPIESVTVNQNYHWNIVIGEEKIQFWRNDVLLGILDTPGTNGQPFQQAGLPVFMMKYNTGSVSNTNTCRVSDVAVTLMDLQTSKPWSHQVATSGKSGYIGQNGQTQGKTTLWTNNTAPTAVALTNTTAAFTGLGGIAAVLPTLAANSDGIIFSYQNPVPSINITGRNLIITGITVQGVVSVVLAGGPVINAYAIAYGHTAVSLATAETASFATATTHAPRIVPIGIESYAANAAVGTVSPGMTNLTFDSPIVVRPGEFVQLIARNLGVVTTTGAITILANFNAYWE